MAVADGRALDRAMYQPSAGQWHRANEGTYLEAEDLCGCEQCANDRANPIAPSCSVCLAGAVMAGALAVDFTTDFSPGKSNFPNTENALRALDSVRCGDFYYAYSQLNLKERYGVTFRRQFLDWGKPENRNFGSWDEFEPHLDSVETFAVKLQEFEDRDPADDPPIDERDICSCGDPDCSAGM